MPLSPFLLPAECWFFCAQFSVVIQKKGREPFGRDLSDYEKMVLILFHDHHDPCMITEPGLLALTPKVSDREFFGKESG